MIHTIKELIFKIEVLGIDTQPIRDLMFAYRGDKNLISNFKDELEILNILLTKGNKPETIKQIDVILKDLHFKVLNPKKVEGPKTESNNSSSVLDIMSKLLDIKADLNEIKSNKNVGGGQTFREDNSNDLSIARVFIDPIDKSKEENIKSNVNIDSEAGGNISNKLNKLRKIKKG